jgi:hypothetical protein
MGQKLGSNKDYSKKTTPLLDLLKKKIEIGMVSWVPTSFWEVKDSSVFCSNFGTAWFWKAIGSA